MRHPFCVGLTGGAGAGKSTVARYFLQQGVGVIDTDEIAHQITAPGGAAMPAVEKVFGSGYLQADGALNRQHMRQLVFSNPQAREQLEAILHPIIRTEAESRLTTAQGPYSMLVVPLLSEHWKDYASLIDRVLVVDCAESIQLERIMSRPGVTRDQAMAMLAAQATRNDRLAMAQDVVDNSGEIALLGVKVAELHRLYLRLAREKMARLATNPLP